MDFDALRQHANEGLAASVATGRNLLDNQIVVRVIEGVIVAALGAYTALYVSDARQDERQTAIVARTVRLEVEQQQATRDDLVEHAKLRMELDSLRNAGSTPLKVMEAQRVEDRDRIDRIGKRLDEHIAAPFRR